MMRIWNLSLIIIGKISSVKVELFLILIKTVFGIKTCQILKYRSQRSSLSFQKTRHTLFGSSPGREVVNWKLTLKSSIHDCHLPNNVFYFQSKKNPPFSKRNTIDNISRWRFYDDRQWFLLNVTSNGSHKAGIFYWFFYFIYNLTASNYWFFEIK